MFTNNSMRAVAVEGWKGGKWVYLIQDKSHIQYNTSYKVKIRPSYVNKVIKVAYEHIKTALSTTK